jgi:signal transduction histidine kinase
MSRPRWLRLPTWLGTRPHCSLLAQALLLNIALVSITTELAIVLPTYTQLVNRVLWEQEQLHALLRDQDHIAPARERIQALLERNRHEVETYRWNRIFLVGAVSALTVTILAVFLWLAIIRPLRKLIAADRAALKGAVRAALIPECHMPANEIGSIMRSRNALLVNLSAREEHAKRLIGRLRTELETKDRLLENSRLQLTDLSQWVNTLEGMKRDVLALVSHELISPLTVGLSIAESLRTGLLESPAERHRALGDLERTLQSMALLVRRMVDLMGLESGSARLCIVPLDFTKLLTEVIEEVRPQAEEKQVRVLFHSSATPLTVPADSGFLAQALRILLENALKFTPAAGTVELSLRRGLDLAELTITDTGPGIAEKQLSAIFNKFSPAAELSHHHEGSGLGLPLALEIARRHSGQLLCNSRPGKGSTFRLTLPLHALAPPERALAETPSAAPKPDDLLGCGPRLRTPDVVRG